MADTPVNAWHTPNLSDVADGPDGFRTLAMSVENTLEVLRSQVTGLVAAVTALHATVLPRDVVMGGASALGTSARLANEDHVHRSGTLTQAGSNVVTTNSQGDGDVVFPITFGAGAVGVVTCNGEHTLSVDMTPWNITTSYFGFRVLNDSGVAVTLGAVRVNWIAHGVP